MLSLPLLLANGLLVHNGLFDFDEGYYSLPSIQLTLAFSFLLRFENIEQISKETPGELGKLIGLDRIPEAKTLREKIALLSGNDQGKTWLSHLSKQWMEMNQELAGILYIDGHEKVYSGMHDLPRRYISRLRLAMRGSTDYWVCDRIGQPFFSVNSTANSSMIEAIKTQIIPRLEQDIPNQPPKEKLDADPFLHKFMIVYDRECYSSDFMIDCWEKRVACCTYNKYVGDKWPGEEFRPCQVETDDGSNQILMMAERCILIQGKETEKLEEPQPVIEFIEDPEEPGGFKTKTTKKRTRKKKQLWVREVRKLRDDGGQTSILTSNYKLPVTLVGLYMFARWCQENFFKYMMKNFGLDMLVSYFTQKMSDTQLIINPLWRQLDKKTRSLQTKLQHLRAKFGELTYDKEIKKEGKHDQDIEKYKKKKAEKVEQIGLYEELLEKAKIKRKVVQRKIPFGELPDQEKFEAVYNERKQFVDTIKLVAYRSETALANTLAKYMNKPAKARALVVQFFKSSSNMIVDQENKTLTIEIHNQPRHMDNRMLENLCKELNKTETVFPNTDLRLVYKTSSDWNKT